MVNFRWNSNLPWSLFALFRVQCDINSSEKYAYCVGVVSKRSCINPGWIMVPERCWNSNWRTGAATHRRVESSWGGRGRRRTLLFVRRGRAGGGSGRGGGFPPHTHTFGQLGPFHSRRRNAHNSVIFSKFVMHFQPFKELTFQISFTACRRPP